MIVFEYNLKKMTKTKSVIYNLFTRTECIELSLQQERDGWRDLGGSKYIYCNCNIKICTKLTRI